MDDIFCVVLSVWLMWKQQYHVGKINMSISSSALAKLAIHVTFELDPSTAQSFTSPAWKKYACGTFCLRVKSLNQDQICTCTSSLLGT